MAGHVGKYAYINAKLRARMSTMLPESLFSRLEGCYSIGDALTLLKETPYDSLSTVYDRTGDLKAVELELFAEEVELHRDLRRQAEESVGDLIEALMLRYEVVALKRALRLWFDRVVRGRSVEEALAYLYRRQICYAIDLDAVVSAGELAGLTEALAKSPYREVIEARGQEALERRTLFPVEAGLDRLYFHRLLEVIDRLDRQDREVALKLVGVEIDIENINRLFRFKEAYRLASDEIRADLIPRGHRVGPKLIESILSSPDAGSRISEILGGEYPELSAMMGGSRSASPLPARLLLIERVLEEILDIEIRRVLAGYPFTVGVVISYFLLARAESRRIRSILNATYYGRSRRSAEVSP